MGRIRVTFFSVFVSAIVIVYAFNPSPNERAIAKILSDSLCAEDWTDKAAGVLSIISKGTEFEAKWQINRPIKKEYLNVYILRPGVLQNANNPSPEFHKLVGTCAFLGKPNLIVCDGQFLQDFMARHRADAGIHESRAFDAYKEEAERNLLIWVLGHEIGHIVNRHTASHFEADSFDKIVESSTISHLQEFEADSFLADHLKADEEMWDSMLHYLVDLLNVEIEKSQGRPAAPGVGLRYYNIPVEYATRGSHPAYVVRCVRLLELLEIERFSSGIGSQVKQFATICGSQMNRAAIVNRECSDHSKIPSGLRLSVATPPGASQQVPLQLVERPRI